jgi:hypothetical protein
VHARSSSDRSRSSGENVGDLRRTIAINRELLPIEKAEKITQRALEITAVTALRRASWMLCAGEDDAARAQLREALKTKRSPAVLERVAVFAALWLREHVARRRSER